MTRTGRVLNLMCLSLALLSPALFTGCAVHRTYRAYDPYDNDYHRWNHNETVYYQQWSVETHHDPHRDYRKLNQNEQKEYWQWRHNHPDRDNDHDRDHDKDRNHH
jgi:hypothetical protein